MAWINPKTNWQPADPVDAAALNRIEGNTLHNRDTTVAHEAAINPHVINGDYTITYSGTKISQITIKNTSNVTIATITPTYSGDNMTGYTFVGGSKNITAVITYNASGYITSITRR